MYPPLLFVKYDGYTFVYSGGKLYKSLCSFLYGDRKISKILVTWTLIG